MPTRLKKETLWYFYQPIGIALTFWAFFGIMLFLLFPKLQLLLKSIAESTKIVCNCERVVSLSSNPFLFGSYLFIGASMVIFFFFAAAKILWIYAETIRYTRRVMGKKSLLSKKVFFLAEKLGIQNSLFEIESGEPLVFCSGFLHPKIFISTNVAKKLSLDELEAVLLHEKEHLKRKDPLKFYILRCIRDIFWFIPGIKKIVQKFRTACELSADFSATLGFQKKSPLARALYKVINFKKNSPSKDSLAISYFSSVIDERINILSDSENAHTYASTLKIQETFSALIFIFATFGIFYNIFLSAPVNTTLEHSLQCQNALAETSTQCEIRESPSCKATYFLESPLCK